MSQLMRHLKYTPEFSEFGLEHPKYGQIHPFGVGVPCVPYDVHYLHTTLLLEMFHLFIEASRTQRFSMIVAEPNLNTQLEPFKIQSLPLARTPSPDLPQLYS